ncbi:MAG: hypothetical protein FWC97_06580 [Treponema sp.]|nr:hypothetical protein [Treponema sp.]
MTSKEKQFKKLQTKSSNFTENYTFNEVVNKACEGLKERQIKYSICRIQEMENTLSRLELELDVFLELR